MTDEFRTLLQTFIRQFGLLSPSRTPCGKPLAPSDAHALLALRDAGAEGLLQGALAATLGVDKSTASRLVARLSTSGHVGAVDSDDGRARPVRLTRKGLKLADELEQSSLGRFAALLRHVPAERRAEVVLALREVNAALRRLNEDKGDEGS